MALGFAGTQAAGLNTFFTSGDLTKSLHPGKASFNGVLSARLALAGGTAPPTMLEHEKGYVDAFSFEPNPAALTKGLGSEWEILQNGYKFFPSILASHAPIQATLAAVINNDLKPERDRQRHQRDLQHREVAFLGEGRHDAHGRAGERALLLRRRRARPRRRARRSSRPDRVMREATSRRCSRTREVVADDALNKLYPAKFPARVTVTIKDGRRFTEMRDFPKGDPQDPLTPEEIEAKFLDNVAGRFDRKTSREIVARVRGLGDGGPAKPLLEGWRRERIGP